MTNLDIKVGDKVTYTNRKGNVLPAVVLDILDASVFGEPMAVIEYTGGHVVGVQQRKKFDELTVIAGDPRTATEEGRGREIHEAAAHIVTVEAEFGAPELIIMTRVAPDAAPGDGGEEIERHPLADSATIGDVDVRMVLLGYGWRITGGPHDTQHYGYAIYDVERAN